MTFYPSKKRQERWIRRYLNKGVVDENRNNYSYSSSIGAACYTAMMWLAEYNIEDLVDAWDKCPRGDWLGWMVSRMEPNAADLRRFFALVKDPPKYLRDEVRAALRTRRRSSLAETLDNCVWQLCHNFHGERGENEQESADLIRKHIPNPWRPKRRAR